MKGSCYRKWRTSNLGKLLSVIKTLEMVRVAVEIDDEDGCILYIIITIMACYLNYYFFLSLKIYY